MSELFDTLPFYGRDMHSHSAVRNDIGDVAELYACAALGMTRQKVDGRKSVCVDALWNDQPVEIKSVGRNNRGLIYKWRMGKDLAEHGDKLIYVFVKHDCTIKKSNSAEIVCHFIEHPPELLVVGIADVAEALKGQKLRKFSLFEGGDDTRVGYNRKGYIDGGWQFSLSILPAPASVKLMFPWAAHTISTTMRFKP